MLYSANQPRTTLGRDRHSECISRYSTNQTIIESNKAEQDSYGSRCRRVLNSDCFTPRAHQEVCFETSGDHPKAPLKAARSLFSFLIHSRASNAQLEEFENDLHSSFNILWPQWDPSSWELTSHNCEVVPSILFAARWSNLETISLIAAQYGQLFRRVNADRQNALVVLCAQPRADILIYEQPNIQPAILRNEMHLPDVLSMLVDGRQKTIESYKILADDREEEMGLIAEILISLGVSPMEEDIHGKTAVDYAKDFAHEKVMEVFNMVAGEKTPVGTHLSATAKTSNLCDLLTPAPKLNVSAFENLAATPLANSCVSSAQLTLRNSDTLPTACDLESATSIMRRRGRRQFKTDSKLSGSNQLEDLRLYELDEATFSTG